MRSINPNTGWLYFPPESVKDLPELHLYPYLLDNPKFVPLPASPRLVWGVGCLNEHEDSVRWFIDEAHKIYDRVWKPGRKAMRLKVDETLHKRPDTDPEALAERVMPFYSMTEWLSIDPIEPWPAVSADRIIHYLSALIDRGALIQRFYLDLDWNHVERERPPWWQFWNPRYCYDEWIYLELQKLQAYTTIAQIDLWVILGSPVLTGYDKTESSFQQNVRRQKELVEQYIQPQDYVIQSWEPCAYYPRVDTMLDIARTI